MEHRRDSRDPGARGMLRVVVDREPYVVDGEGQVHDDRVRAVGLVLELLGPAAASYECDVPIAGQEHWPVPVRDAAARLVAAIPDERRTEQEAHEQGSYYGTGLVERHDPGHWDAFTTVAAYAFDATVWSQGGAPLVDLADEGWSLVAWLTGEETAQVAAVVGPGRVVPLPEWRRRRRGRRRAARWWRRT